MASSVGSLRPGWVAIGWFIAIALTSLFLIALEALGLVGETPSGEALPVALALAAAFFAAGILVGTRSGAAPVLHGLAMGLFSLLAWVAINLFLGEPTGETTWRSLDAVTTGGLILLQAISAALGATAGVRWVRSAATSPA
jgi:hypothetical protein